MELKNDFDPIPITPILQSKASLKKGEQENETEEVESRANPELLLLEEPLNPFQSNSSSPSTIINNEQEAQNFVNQLSEDIKNNPAFTQDIQSNIERRRTEFLIS